MDAGYTDYSGIHTVHREFGYQNGTYMLCVYDDSIVLFDRDIQRVRMIENPLMTYQSLNYSEYYYSSTNEWRINGSTDWSEGYYRGIQGCHYIGSIGEPLIEKEGLLLTQTLFNTDAKFEFLQRQYGNEFVFTPSETSKYHKTRLEGFNIVNEDQEVVNTIRCADNETFGYNNHGNLEFLIPMIFSFDGNWYIACNVTNTSGVNMLRYYRIDRQFQKVEQVANVPFTVHPTVMDKGQEIIVELDEGTNAREIEVVNTLGQMVKRVPVTSGQREVHINSSDFSTGMNFVNTHTSEGHGTVKIIVR